MPDFKIRDPQSGRTITLRGDSPPTEQELEQIFAQFDKTPMPTSGKGPQDVTPATSKPSPAERTWTDTIIDALPAAGATLGGIIGGAGGTAFGFGFGGIPGSVGGAALGGAAGESARELVNELIRGKQAPASSTEAAKNIVGEGLIQGGTDLAGGVVGNTIIRPTAKAFTKFAFRPTRQALKTAPKLVDDILDNSIALSEKGVAKAEARTGAARAAADQLVDDLENRPNVWMNDTNIGTFGSKRASVKGELFDPVFGVVRKGSTPNAMGAVEQRALRGSGRKTLANAADDLIDNNPLEVGPKRLQEIKRAEGTAAGQVFNQAGEKQALRGKIAADIHNAADDALARRIGPKWNAANAETQRRLMVQKTAEEALGSSALESHVPNPYDQFLLMRGLATGNPVDTAIAVAREAGRARRIVAAAGRGVNQVQKKRVLTEGFRYGRELTQEDEANSDVRRRQDANRKPAKKAQVDTLYEKYSKR